MMMIVPWGCDGNDIVANWVVKVVILTRYLKVAHLKDRQ